MKTNILSPLRRDGLKAGKTIIAVMALSAVLTACSSEDSPTENPEQRVPVTLAYTAIDATETRAAQNLNEGTFSSGESVMVRISDTGINTWDDYTFTTGDAGAMTPPNPAPYYPAGAQNIDIVAYYPANAGTSFSVATNQALNSSYKASDLMFASVTNQAKQAGAVNLTFSHKMAKICVNIDAGDGVSSISSLNLMNVRPTLSFDQATGAVGNASGTRTTITISNHGAALIPAQTINGVLLEISTPQGVASYSVTNKVFEIGKCYTINITVNLRAVGRTTAITDWTNQGTVTVNSVETQRAPEGVKAIDMGSGLKWANMNVGAESPSDYGDHFAWGEVIAYYHNSQWIYGKSGYNWANYSLCDGSNTNAKMLKYSTNTSYGYYADNKTTLERTNDAATANWGDNWRMPTDAEWTWLRNNCTWTWTNQNGVNGRLVTSNINGNSIFLPAAGYRTNANHVFGGTEGDYWSSSLNTSSNSSISNAWSVSFISNGLAQDWKNRCNGLSVRPVK